MAQELYDLPEGWDWIGWSDALEIIGGKNQKNVVAGDGEYPIYGSGGEMGRAKDFLCPAFTTIIGRKGTINRPLYTEEPVWNVDTAFGLASNESLDAKLLFYFCRAFNFLSLNRSTTLPSLTKRDLYTLKIPLPPLNEQKRIVARLDALFTRIDTAITHLQQTLELSKALFASALSTEFQSRDKNWQPVQLADVCSITSKLSDPREPEYIDMIHVGGANIETLTGRLRKLKTAREEKLISGKFPFDARMVLYSKIRPYLMKVARPNINGLCSADIYPLTPNSEVLVRDFLFYLLLSEDFSTYAIQGSSRAGMPKVNRKHLFSYKFSIPPIEEQKKITDRLDALSERTRSIESSTQEKLNDLASLKASLLDAAFKGQL